VVKYRKPLLVTYGDQVKAKIQKLSGTRWRIEKMEVDRDHIHLLIEYGPQISITNIVKSIKSQTTHDLWLNNESELKRQFWKHRTFWGPSFFACSIGNASKEIIAKYITT
jgi:putative transposase